MRATGPVEPRTASEQTDHRTRAIGILCSIAVVLLFSAFTLVSRIDFESSLRLADITALRFIMAGMLMLPVLLYYGVSRVRWRDAAALAFTGGLGFALCAYTGFSLAPASHGAVLLHGTLPLFTFALAWLTSSATATGRRALGLAAILLGILATASDSFAGSALRQWLGDGSSRVHGPEHQPEEFFSKYSRPVRRVGDGVDAYQAFAEIEARRGRRGGHGDDAYRRLAEIEDERSWWGRSW